MNTLTLHAILRLQLYTMLLSLVRYVKGTTLTSHLITSLPFHTITILSFSLFLLRLVTALFRAWSHQLIAVWLPLVSSACQVFPLNLPTLSAWESTSMRIVISVCTSSPFLSLSTTFPLFLLYLMDFQLNKMVVSSLRLSSGREDVSMVPTTHVLVCTCLVSLSFAFSLSFFLSFSFPQSFSLQVLIPLTRRFIQHLYLL